MTSPGPELNGALRVHNKKVIEADRQPGILARELGSMLRTAREVTELSYDQAAARLGCEADWLVRMETGFAPVSPVQVARILVEWPRKSSTVRRRHGMGPALAPPGPSARRGDPAQSRMILERHLASMAT